MTMVTLREIAARCACSVATVSKALNDMPDISPATASHIRSVAATMGYLPNAAARALKTNHSKIVGLLMFIRGESLWTHDYFSEIAASIQRVMSADGYDVVPIDTSAPSVMNNYVDYCRYRNYDGIIILSAGDIDAPMQALVNSDIPLVTIDYAFHNRGAVLSDNAQGIHDLMHFVYEHGHRRIAYIYGEETEVTNNRVASFYACCDELGIAVDDAYMKRTLYRDPDASAKATAELMALPVPPTCILYPDDYSYIGGWNELIRMGLQVPQDVSCVGYDGIRLATLLRPKLTTLRQDADGIGENAARMLIKAVEKRRSYLPKQVVLQGRLIPGETVLDISQQRIAQLL